MNVLILAKANAPHAAASFEPMARFPGQGDLMTWCQDIGIGSAILLILVGLVYLLYGWSMYKPLVTLNAAIIGGYIGASFGAHYGGALVGGAFGAIIAASTTLWLMKWAVAVMGGIVGAVVGAGIWRACGQPADFAWAGAMTGLVGFGMFSFILFRGSVIMYTSLEGAALLIVGLLGLAFKYQGLAPAISGGLNAHAFALPAVMFIPAVVGLFYQQVYGGAGAGGPASAGGDKKK